MKYNFSLFKNIVKIFLLLIPLLLINISYSQTLLTGKVKDEVTGEAISMVSVKNLSIYTGTVTNDSGYYELKCNKGDFIEFSKTGFITFKVKYTGVSILNIFLEPAIVNLEEVFISASKGQQSIKNTSVSVESIKPYIIDNKTPVTAENTVDQIPGVQAINGQVVMRSGSGWSYGTGSRVAVLLDGLPLQSGDAGQVQWSFLPLENIENIEVIKGASSVLFGSSALNGVINFITKMPTQNKKIIANSSTFVGLYDNFSRSDAYKKGYMLGYFGIRVFQMQKINKNYYSIRLNYFNDAGYRMSDNDNRIQIGAKYKRELSKINGFCGVNFNVHTGKSASFLLWESDKLPYTSLDSEATRNSTFKMNIDPFVNFNFKGWKNSFQLRYFKLSNEVVQDTSKHDQSNFSNTFFGEYQISKNFIKHLTITGGLAATLTYTRSPLYQGNQRAENRAVFSQLNFSKGILNFDAGIRYELYKLNNYTESKPVIRSGISIKAAKATFLRISYGQGYRFPTIAETYVYTSAGSIMIFPNKDLKSEKGWSSELGIKQGFKKGKISAVADLAFFVMQYQRMMEFTFGIWETPSLQNPNYAGFKSLNVSDAQIAGIDFSLMANAKWRKNEIKFMGGYTYANAKPLKPDEVFYKDVLSNELTFNNTSSNPESNFLKYRPKHLVRFDVQHEIKSFESGLSLRYNSFIENIDNAFIKFPISAAVPGIENIRQSSKNGDWVFDLRIGKKISKFKILLSVNNLFNRKYMTRPCDIRPPRTFLMQLTCNL